MNVDALVKRAFLSLEDGDYEKAYEFLDQVLNENPEHAMAYVGLLCVDLKLVREEDLITCQRPFSDNNNYKKALRFGDATLVERLQGYNRAIINRINTESKENYYDEEVIRRFDIIQGMHEFTQDQCRMKLKALAELSDKIQSLRDHSNANTIAKQCEQMVISLNEKIEVLKKQAEQQKIESLEKEKKQRQSIIKLGLALLALCVVLGAGICIYKLFIVPPMKYKKANELIVDKQYTEAAFLYNQIPNYKDSRDKIGQLQGILTRRIPLDGGNFYAKLKEDGTVAMIMDNTYGKVNVSDWRDIRAISVGFDYIVGLREDGTVVASGNNGYEQCNVSDWSDIVAIWTGRDYTVGLKKDGTVIATGNNHNGQCDVLNWSDIVSISIGRDSDGGNYSGDGAYTVGLKKDGTVVATGYNGNGECDVTDWSDITAISVNYGATVGLKKDGTVVAIGKIDYGIGVVSGWKDIISIAVDYSCIMGLKKDGTVVTAKDIFDTAEFSSQWDDIVAISCAFSEVVGLKKDGTVVVVGFDTDSYHKDLTSKFTNWTDIVAVSAHRDYIVGLKKDGTIVSTSKYMDE